jgi:hypothetical protein
VPNQPARLGDLKSSGWRSRSVKAELRENLTRALAARQELFPGIVGYEDTVIPEIVNAILAGHDMLFLGEKGQGKSRLMRTLVRFLDESTPYLDIPGSPVHEDPFNPITQAGRAFVAEHGDQAPIAWWGREDRYAERLAPGTKFADVIGEIDPAKLAAGLSHGRGGSPALRPDPADAPRHLRHERAPRPGRLGAGGAVQHPRRAGRPDPRVSRPLRPGHPGPLLGQSEHVQPLGQGHPAAQGPHRLDDPDPLPAGTRRGHPDHGAGGAGGRRAGPGGRRTPCSCPVS